MTNHFNKLTEAEAERLAILAEECGEVIQIVGKILRHGYDSCHPTDPTQATNRIKLKKELTDVSFAAWRMLNYDDIENYDCLEAYEGISDRKSKYYHHQEED